MPLEGAPSFEVLDAVLQHDQVKEQEAVEGRDVQQQRAPQ
jgi:hypothetical protein